VSTLIALALLANFLTYLFFTTPSSHFGQPEIARLTNSPNSNRYTYIIAGFLGQADEALRALANLIEGNVIFLNYTNFSYSPRAFIQTVIDDKSRPADAKITIIGISIGDQVAVTAADLLKAQHIAINPCLNIKTLSNPALRASIKYLFPLADTLRYFLGWLSIIPFSIKRASPIRSYSLATLVDQLRTMAHFDAVGTPDSFVIISRYDKLLNNKEIKRQFAPHATYFSIDADHASANLYPGTYASALKDAGLIS
jgi:predicted esterase YcpF (UPF0227 family)